MTEVEVTLVCVHDCEHGSVDEVGGTTMKVIPLGKQVWPAVILLDLDFDIGNRSFSGGIQLSEKDARAVASAIVNLLEGK